MAASADPNDVAAVSAQVHRLVQRYPETSNAVFIVVMVVGFLLIVPIVFLAAALCVAAKVNVALGFIGGVVLWLGVFMFLRQLLLWRRVQKVNAFVRDFNHEFSADGLRETALACLVVVDGESNEVAVQVRERLGAGKQRSRHALRSGQVLHAGQGLAPVADPVIDRQVEQFLRPLNGKLRVKSAIHWLLGLGLPIAFFVLGCIFEPDADSLALLWTTAVVMVVWNLVFVFIVSMVEVSIVGAVTRSFQARFPKDSSERGVAMAAFSRIAGFEKAKAALRSDLRTEEADDVEAVSDGERLHTRKRYAPAPEPVQPAPVFQVPVLDPLPGVAPATVQEQRSAAGNAAIPLEPVGATKREIQVPPPPGRAIPLQASASPAPAPDPASPHASAPAFCTRCGQRGKEQDRFCTGCGKKLF